MNTPTQTESALYVAPLEKFYQRLISPIEQFVHRQTSGGIVLMACIVIAMIIVNSPAEDIYRRVTHLYFGFQVGNFELKKSLIHWINDGLMVIFFLLVGLEIKREIMVGELSTISKAALPAIAALGGMVMPALFYLLFNPEGDARSGWGIPMATDIAFAVGVLALLGKRVPSSVMTFLLALAIADDLGAVIVIGLFYTKDLYLTYLFLAGAFWLVLLVLNLLGVRAMLPYLLVGFLLWLAMLKSGVHATLAGILIAIAIPARPKYDPKKFSDAIRALIDTFDMHQSRSSSWQTFASKEQASLVEAIETIADEAASPLRKLESNLHGFSAFFIIPVFALANGGVAVDWESLSHAFQNSVTLGVLFGLTIGKLIGISGFAWLAVKLGLGAFPEGTSLKHIIGVGWLGGIGFTMSIFIADLALDTTPALIDAAKMGILCASLVAGISGYLWLYIVSTANQTKPS